MKGIQENLKISATCFPFHMYPFYTDVDSVIYHCKKWFNENIKQRVKKNCTITIFIKCNRICRKDTVLVSNSLARRFSPVRRCISNDCGRFHTWPPVWQAQRYNFYYSRAVGCVEISLGKRITVRRLSDCWPTQLDTSWLVADTG